MTVPYLIFSWEHNAFWRPGHCGYTRFIDRAGRYSKVEAEQICERASYGGGRRYAFATDADPDTPPNEICFPAPEAFANLAEAAQETVQLLRSYETHHRGEAAKLKGSSCSERPVRLAKAERNAAAAALLEKAMQ